MPPLVASTIRSRRCGGGGEDLAEDLLDLAEPGAAPVEPVDVGVVDEVHPRIERSLEHRLRLGDVGVREPPQPERQRADRRQ